MLKLLPLIFLLLFSGCETADYIFGKKDEAQSPTLPENNAETNASTIPNQPLDANPSIIITPSAVIKVNTLRAEAPYTFRLDAEDSIVDPSLSILSYTWSSSDQKSIASIVNPSIRYEKAGSYLLTLRVEDSQHQVSVITQSLVLSEPDAVVVEPVSPIARLSLNAVEGYAPFTLLLNASDSMKDPEATLTHYEWSITGVNEVKEGMQSSFILDNVGTYVVSLKVTDSNAKSDIKTLNIKVLPKIETPTEPDNNTTDIENNQTNPFPPVYDPLTISLTSSTLEGEAPLEISFDVDVLGGDGNYSYVWTSGDGVVDYTTKDKLLTYSYANAGSFLLSLEIHDEHNNSKTVTRTVEVSEKSLDNPTSLSAFTQIKDIPTLNETYYSEATTNNHTILSYEKPTLNIAQGQAITMRVLLPTGTTIAAMYGQGHTSFFYGAKMGVFDEDPGLFCGSNTVCSLEKLALVGDGFNPTLYQGSALRDPVYKYVVFYNESATTDNFTSISTQIIIGDNAAYNTWRSELGFSSVSSKIINYKSNSAKDYPQDDPLDASSGSIFDPITRLYSDYAKKYYFHYARPITDWNLAQGEGAYVKFFIPPGVSEVGISFNDASLASQSIELADFGEYDVHYQVPSAFDYNAHTWYTKGANSRVYSHERDADKLGSSSSLILSFYDKDNLYANVNLGQFDVNYYIKAEDLALYEAWAASHNQTGLKTSYPDDGSNKTFIGGSLLPTLANQSSVFTNETPTNSNYIYHFASSAPAKLPWELSLGQSGYIRLYMPPGITQVNMGLNSESLAASQSIYFKNMGEASCDAAIPNAPDYENSPQGWEVFTGSKSYTYNRDLNNTAVESCVLYAFYDYDNLHSSVFLQDVSFSYLAGERALYDDWVAPKLYFDPVNGDNSSDGSLSSPKASLSSALASGQTFEDYTKVILRTGNHGAVSLNTLNPAHSIHFQAYEDEEPIFSQLNIKNSSHLYFQAITIDGSLSHLGRDNFMVNSDETSHFLSFDKMLIKSADDSSIWLKADWYANSIGGMRLQGEDINVSNSLITNVYHAVMLDGNRAYYAHNTIDNFAGDAIRGLGDDSTYEYNTVRDCYIDDYDIQHDDAFQAFRTVADNNYKIKNVTLRGNKILLFEDPITQFVIDNNLIGTLMQGMINTDGHADSWIVENNLVVSNRDHGISLYGATSCRVQNNTVVKHPYFTDTVMPRIYLDDMKKVGQEHSNTSNTIRNNISTVMTTWTFDASSIIENNHDINEKDRSNLINLFADYDHHNFHLKSSSSALDVGVNTEVTDKDADGLERVYNGTVDLGAFEYRGE